MPRLLPLAAALLLAGCSKSISIRHDDPVNEAARLSRVQLVLLRQPSYEENAGALSKAADFMQAFVSENTDRKYTHPLSAADYDELACRAAERLAASSMTVVSYQVAYAKDPAPWTSSYGPGLTVTLKADDEFKVSQEMREQVVKGTTETYRWLGAKWNVDWRTYVEPERLPLGEGSYPSGKLYEEKGGTWKAALDDYMEPRMWDLLSAFSGSLVKTIRARSSGRTIRKGKDAYQKAYERVDKKDWDGAAAIWTELGAKPGEWEAHFNLGVHHERAARWAEAEAAYRAALSRAPNDDRARIKAALAELVYLSVAPPAPSGVPFHEVRTAVLPFANETVDLTSPDYARAKSVETLERWGYKLQPPAETDAKLLEKGIREGGQLGLLPPKQLAAHLGVERLLYGTVEEFKTINVGILYRRQVRVRFRMTGPDGGVVWQNAGQFVAQTGAKPSQAAASFLVGAAMSYAQKLTKVYLKDETDEAVGRGLETLPRPPRLLAGK